MQRQIFQVEIRTRDLERTIAFYGGLFDWGFYRTGPDYALIDTGHLPVASIMKTADPAYPLGVCNLVLVEDCEKEARRAVELGGRIVVEKWPVPGSGWFTGTVDPWGNELFFWQPSTPARPTPSRARDDRIVLLEIPTPDVEAGIAYYRRLVGWSFDAVTFGGNYAFTPGCGLERGVALVGGPFAHRVRRPVDYVAVADLSAVEQRVRGGGGTVVIGPIEVPGDMTYLVFDDPEGNRMGALQLAPPS
jgi:predicted enzyme related to lactoylglutathione lyase